MREAAKLGRLGDVDELRKAELAARIIDIGLPAEIGADVLHLDSDLAHLAPQFVVDELIAGVRHRVAGA